jgi:hypothetical protein
MNISVSEELNFFSSHLQQTLTNAEKHIKLIALMEVTELKYILAVILKIIYCLLWERFILKFYFCGEI